ncbi:MAG TPA: hypothetical protein VMJ65_05500 [Solirubrobacteraceae bacterium]|nr:hypothetical protein [Solirubrobacteraceae bacterium]
MRNSQCGLLILSIHEIGHDGRNLPSGTVHDPAGATRRLPAKQTTARLASGSSPPGQLGPRVLLLIAAEPKE